MVKNSKCPLVEKNQKDPDLCAELQMKLWSLEETLDIIEKDYHQFYCDLSWAHYGDFIILKRSIEKVFSQFKVILEKMEKGKAQ